MSRFLLPTIGLFLLMAGCQTVKSQNASDDISLTYVSEISFKKYLAIFSHPEMRKQQSVFMIQTSPSDDFYLTQRRYFGGSKSHVSETINRLNRSCNYQCKIFAVNREIVQRYHPRADEFKALARKYESYASHPLKYFDEANFELGGNQIQTLGPLMKDDIYHKATAVSVDELTVGRYSMKGFNGYTPELLKQLAYMSCLAASDGKECYIYSYDGHIYKK